MTIQIDPEKKEIKALLAMANFNRQQVLEIGSGDGRLTWRYAGQAGHVTAVEPWDQGIARALKAMPGELRDRVEFIHAAFLDFAAARASASFDIAILSWSLC